MDVRSIVAELTEKYPGGLIKVLPPGENATEIVCEYGRDPNHPDSSEAVAVIDRSAPHFHRVTEERYTILRGTLELHTGDNVHTLHEGETFTIKPHTIHWATGNATWVQVNCRPMYSPADHILV